MGNNPLSWTKAGFFYSKYERSGGPDGSKVKIYPSMDFKLDEEYG